MEKYRTGMKNAFRVNDPTKSYLANTDGGVLNKTKSHSQQIRKSDIQEINVLGSSFTTNTDKWYYHNHQQYLIVSALQWNTSSLRPIPWSPAHTKPTVSQKGSFCSSAD